MNHVTNLNNAKILTDPRYGKVLVVDSLDAVQLNKLDVAYAGIDAGATSPPHYHERTEEIYVIAKGSATIVINGIATPVVPGAIIRIPVYTVHSISAGSEGCEFWVSTSPPYSSDDDIETDAVRVDTPATDGATNEASVRIALIIGTHRAGSLSANIGRQIAGMYDELGVAVDLIDPAELPNELYHPESYETRYDPNTPLARRLIDADGLVAIVPEYNGSYPAPLKHMLDIVPYKNAFEGKPVTMVGVAAGDWGAIRAVDQLSTVFAYRCAHLYGKRVFIRNVDEALKNENGYLSDPQLVARLRAQAAGFAQFVRSLAPVRVRA